MNVVHIIPVIIEIINDCFILFLIILICFFNYTKPIHAVILQIKSIFSMFHLQFTFI